MPHHSISTGLMIMGFGVVPSTIVGVSALAQVATDGHVDWTNLGAVTAIIAMMGFLLTKLLPKINEDNNQTVRHLSDNMQSSIENQRRDFIELLKGYDTKPTTPTEGNNDE